MNIILTSIALLGLASIIIEYIATIHSARAGETYDFRMNLYRMSLVIIVEIGVLVVWLVSRSQS